MPGRAPRARATRPGFSPEAPDEPGPSGRLPLSAMPPPGARDHPVAAFGSAPYKDWQGVTCVPGRPPGGAAGGGAGGRRKGEGVGGGDSSEGRILRPWEAAAATRGSERSRSSQGAGRRRLRRQRRRKGPERGRASAAEATERGRAGGWLRARAGAAATAIAASEAQAAAAAATGARVRAPRRPPGAGRHDGAAARASRARSPQPGLGGTGGYRARAHPSRLSLLLASPPPPLPARVPFRKRSGMRSPAASQPGQRFLRRPGSSSRAARSAFVRSAGALPRGASGDGPSRTVSALHPLPNFALHSRVWRGGSGRGGGGAARSAGGAGRRRDSPLDRALAVTWARRFPRTAAWGGE